MGVMHNYRVTIIQIFVACFSDNDFKYILILDFPLSQNGGKT